MRAWRECRMFSIATGRRNAACRCRQIDWVVSQQRRKGSRGRRRMRSRGQTASWQMLRLDHRSSCLRARFLVSGGCRAINRPGEPRFMPGGRHPSALPADRVRIHADTNVTVALLNGRSRHFAGASPPGVGPQHLPVGQMGEKASPDTSCAMAPGLWSCARSVWSIAAPAPGGAKGAKGGQRGASQ